MGDHSAAIENHIHRLRIVTGYADVLIGPLLTNSRIGKANVGELCFARYTGVMTGQRQAYVHRRIHCNRL